MIITLSVPHISLHCFNKFQTFGHRFFRRAFLYLVQMCTWCITAAKPRVTCPLSWSRWLQTQSLACCILCTSEQQWKGWYWRKYLKQIPTSNTHLPGTDLMHISKRSMALWPQEVRSRLKQTERGNNERITSAKLLCCLFMRCVMSSRFFVGLSFQE